VRMFGQYAVQKNMSVRLDLIYDRFHTTDWTYTNFVYADGTTGANLNASSTFLGVSLVYRFQ
jgi:predicted porin